MPTLSSPPKPDPKQKHNRSRGGCRRCKGRRQKCDEQKPMCSRCKTDGAKDCSYTVNLQWGGRRFQSYAQNADIKKYETEPGTFVYVAGGAKGKKLKTFSSPPASQSSPTPTPDDKLTRSLSPLDSSTPSEQLLLHHFANEASKITSCHLLIQSNFNSILLPMALSYPPLLSALLALSLIHRTSLFSTKSSSSTSTSHQSHSLPNSIMSLKTLSITKLRLAMLSASHFPQEQQLAEPLLATALTLCMCEIHSGGDLPRSWRLHLEGASAILSQSSQLSRPFDPNTTSGLLRRWYDSVEALAAITLRGLRAGQLPCPPTRPPRSNIEIQGVEGVVRVAQEIEGEENVFLDDYYGFCTDLIGAFKEIGAAGWERRSLSAKHSLPSPSASILSSSDLDTEAAILEQKIRYMLSRDSQIPPKFYLGVREKLDVDVVAEFYKCNEAYQHTALLYIYRRVRMLDRTDSKVQECVSNILECVDKIKPRSGLSPYIVLVPPLFAAGQEAFGEDRERVRKSMRDFGEFTRMRNVRRSFEYLELGWEMGGELLDGEDYDFIPY